MIRAFLEQFFLFAIRLYQIFLSPFFGKDCRFYPTCSVYAKQAIVKYGPYKGSFLAICRILRCNPWNKKYGHNPLK